MKGRRSLAWAGIVLLVGIALFALFLTFSGTLQTELRPHGGVPPEILPSHPLIYRANPGEEVLKTAEEAADSFNGAN